MTILKLKRYFTYLLTELGIGGVLLQKQGDLMMPVKFVSCKLLKSEQAYFTGEKECLAVVWTVRQLYKYI